MAVSKDTKNKGEILFVCLFVLQFSRVKLEEKD